MKITISKSNTKLGNIASFSIPAVSTCPGRTAWCEKKCYALKLEKRFPNVRKSYQGNLEVTQDVDFVSRMTTELAKVGRKTQIIRLHVSGDFYSAQYIKDWKQIITNCPGLVFYTYTKSWMVDALLSELEELKKLPNLTMFASTDIDTLNNQLHPPVGWREAYAGDIQPAKSVFCLDQAGKMPTCESCKLCFKPQLKSTIYFRTH